MLAKGDPLMVEHVHCKGCGIQPHKVTWVDVGALLLMQLVATLTVVMVVVLVAHMIRSEERLDALEHPKPVERR